MAEIEKINQTLKISKQVSNEPFTTKSLSLGAEAAVSPNETFEMAAEELYHKLASELRLLWGTSIKEDRDTKAQEIAGDEEIEEPPAPVDPSWCPIHKATMKMRSKKGRSWYSHKVGEQWCQGHWCKDHNMPFKRYTNDQGGSWWSHYIDEEDLWCREEEE